MMEKNDLIVKILFNEPEINRVLWIIGVVDEGQLNSNENNFILIKNYYNKTIYKDNIIDFNILEVYESGCYNVWNLA